MALDALQDSLGAHVAVDHYGAIRIDLVSDEEVSVEVDAATRLHRAMDIQRPLETQLALALDALGSLERRRGRFGNWTCDGL